MRLAVIGDVGGHYLQFCEQLWALDIDVEQHKIPSDLIVCQVGDLVHKGPDSAAVVALVDALLQANPGRWIQLLGNHEAQYVNQATAFWKPAVDRGTVATIQRWWESGMMRIAAGFSLAPQPPLTKPIDSSPGGQLLVTHAGLTCGAYRLLDEPTSVAEIVAALNAGALPTRARGSMLTGSPHPSTGPIWAIAASEVYASWANYDLANLKEPDTVFHQSHGHTSAMSWRYGRKYTPLDKLVRRDNIQFRADTQRKITRTTIKGRTFFGVDPESGTTPSTVSLPLVLPLAAVPDPDVAPDSELGQLLSRAARSPTVNRPRRARQHAARPAVTDSRRTQC